MLCLYGGLNRTVTAAPGLGITDASTLFATEVHGVTAIERRVSLTPGQRR